MKRPASPAVASPLNRGIMRRFRLFLGVYLLWLIALLFLYLTTVGG